MRSIFLIPMTIAGTLGLCATAMEFSGFHVKPIDPLAAGMICAIAGVLGMLPVLRSGRKDPVSIVQMALAGTILHLVIAASLGVVFLATHIVNPRGAFAFWLLGGYWISLVTLIWQLRRLLLATVGTAKVQK